jgi:hypothetical protein
MASRTPGSVFLHLHCAQPWTGPEAPRDNGAAMHIFLSYASEDSPKAEEIALALRATGHEVFFDRSSLSGGEDYHSVIRTRIAESDLFLFLITPRSIEEGAYSLTELRMARDKWAHPKGHVLPVLLERTDMDKIPAYLRSVTLFQPEGNAAAEITAHLGRDAGLWRTYARGGAAIALLIGVAFGASKLVDRARGDRGEKGTFVSRIEPSQFVSHYVLPPDIVEKTEYTLDPTSRFPREGEDMVRIDRVSFGDLKIEDASAAFSVALSVTNTGTEPILLDMTPRFFELVDDQGRRAELLYLCCEARGDRLAPGLKRVVQLIYRSVPGWQGKETSAGAIHFRVSGLLPLVQGVWSFRPLAVAE